MTSDAKSERITLPECQQLRQSGDVKAALECYRHLLVHEPANLDALVESGELLGAIGRLEEAAGQFSKAVDVDPDSLRARFNLAAALTHTGSLDEAQKQCHKIIAEHPDFAPAYQQLGGIFHVQGDFANAVRNLRESVRIQPDNVMAITNLGAALQFQGRFAKAEQQYRRALDVDPANNDALCNLGLLCLQLGRLNEAAGYLSDVLNRLPDHPAALAGLAEYLSLGGRHKEAVAKLRTIMEQGILTPNIAIAYARSQCGLDKAEAAIPLVLKALELPNLTTTSQVQLRFSLGDALQQLSRYDEAFLEYEKANRQAGVDYDHNETVRIADEIISAFSAEAMKTLPRAHTASRKPVFVLGMPRSGKTLVEQILASHPAVFGAGELTSLGRLSTTLQQRLKSKLNYPMCVKDLTSGVLDDLAAEYLSETKTLSNEADRIVDTMPGNFQNIGLINLMFPAAGIIECVRDPLDVIFSCYTRYISGRRFSFSFDLGNAANFLSNYQRVIEHWRDVSPAPILRVRYEELVQNTESIARKLIDFVGLEWNPQCLEYYRDGIATTARDERIRDRLHNREVGRWRNYQKHLGEAKHILNIGAEGN